MIKMSIHTLIAVFLVMLIAGNDNSAPSAPVTNIARASQPDLLPAALYDAAKIDPSGIARNQSDPVLTPAALTATPNTPATITPLAARRMPGPALRPSPEYRTAAPATATDNPALWVVDATALNVRSGPSTGHGVLDRLTRGEEVLVLSDNGAGWLQIRIEGDGVEGWVSRKLLRPAP